MLQIEWLPPVVMHMFSAGREQGKKLLAGPRGRTQQLTVIHIPLVVSMVELGGLRNAEWQLANAPRKA